MVCNRGNGTCNVCGDFCLRELFSSQYPGRKKVVNNFHLLDFFGSIFSDKNYMHDSMGNEHSFNRKQYSSNNSILHFDGSYYLHCILETIKQDFKTQSVGLKIADIFGLPSIAFSLLNIVLDKNIFSQMPSGFRYTIFIFACGYLLTLFLRGYERYRADKLQNDKNYFNWEIEKERILKDRDNISKN